MNHLYEQFASYVSRNRINGSLRVWCKPRIIFSPINGLMSFVALYATTILFCTRFVAWLVATAVDEVPVLCVMSLVLDTRRAAQFSLSRTDCGNPHRSTLQKSSLDEIKARASISASSWEKQFRIFAIFLMWIKAGIHNMFLQVDVRIKNYIFISSTTWDLRYSPATRIDPQWPERLCVSAQSPVQPPITG